MKKLSKPSILFIAIFFIAIIVQTLIWWPTQVLDDTIWEPAIKKIVVGQKVSTSDYEFGYPGTSLTVPASLLVKSGVHVTDALKVTLIFFISLFVACAGVLTYILRPHRLWWLIVTSMLIFHAHYIQATPPSSLIPLIILILLLLFLKIRENENVSKTDLALVGVFSGIAFSMRLDISIALLGSAFVYAFIYMPRLRRSLWIPIIIACTVAVMYTPDFLSPIDYLVGMNQKIQAHYFHSDSGIGMYDIVAVSPLGVLGVFIAIIFLSIKKYIISIPKDFLIWIIVTTAIIFIILFRSSYRPIWYFYPLFLIWETLFSLFMLEVIENIDPKYFKSGLRPATIKYLFISLLIASQILILLFWEVFPRMHLI
jgi:hypothetical protein